MRCNRCGSQVYNGEFYCGECGNKINFSNENIQENNYNYSYKGNSKTKKTIIIILLIIIVIFVILGIIGLLTDNEDVNNTITQNNNINNSTVSETTNNGSLNNNTNKPNTNTNTYTSSNTIDNNYNNNNNNNNNSNSSTTNNSNQKAYTRYYLQNNGQDYDNIYIELSGNNIYLYDNDLEIYFTGTFKVNNNFITGAYKEVKYNNGGDIITIECNDEFEFKILSTKQIQDNLGYYSYVNGDVVHTNSVYNKE